MKLFRKPLSLLLSICMILNIFVIIPTVQANAEGYRHYVFLDTNNIEHGTVTPVNFNDGGTYQEEYRCLMNVTPDEGYKFKAWHITAYPSGKTIEAEIYDTYHSFVIPVFPRKDGRQNILIAAEFEEIDPDEPDGPYIVSVYSPDPDGTGSFISIDHADAKYNAGDLVTVTVNWAPGTRFAHNGLYNSDYTGLDGYSHDIEFTKVDESTYTFIMPATYVGTNVRLSCFFEFIPYQVNYETDFGDAQISYEERARIPTIKPSLFLYNDSTGQWDYKNWPVETHRDQVFRVDTYNRDEYCCTGITAVYQENGQTVEKDIVTDSGYGFGQMRDVYGKMTMPAADVKLKLKMEKLLYVRTVNTAQGTVTTSLSRTKPGDEVTVTVTPAANCACTGIKVTDANGQDVPLSADNKFTMPDTDVTVSATFEMGYVDREWDGSQVTEEVKAVPADKLVEITSVSNHTLQSGNWYVVRGNVTFNDRLNVNGDVNIVLCDGATLNANNGISVNNGASLHIYDQQGGTGKLTATSHRLDNGSASMKNAAIGADSGNAGNIYIHGGNINAKAELACRGAAIGGGGDGAAGEIKIYGGTVDAWSDQCGAAIGGGQNGQASHVNGEGIVIYGGKVTAKAGSNSAGIGNGYKANGSAGSIAIYGGEVTASGHNGAAGIGGGDEGSNGKIDIYGGVVTAIAYDSIATGAAIGSGGKANQGGAINIHGGTVAAQSTYGAGIGAGANGSSGTINISGGNVVASSSCGGAGIGGGKGGNGGSITISGGEVTGRSAKFDNAGEVTDFFLNYIGDMNNPEFEQVIGPAVIAGIAAIVEYLILDTEYSGAGIGGGHGGAAGSINVTGGVVTAISGLDSANAIGHGKGNNNVGNLSIYNTAKVTAGASENSARAQLSANRVPSCRNNKYAHIEPCGHYDENHEHQLEYIDAGFDGHRQRCALCNIEQEGIFPHDYWKGGECVKCHHKSKITIQKVWADDQQDHPDEVTVNITSVWKRSVNGTETDDLVVTLNEENEWKAEVPAVWGRHMLTFTEEPCQGYVADSWTFCSPSEDVDPNNLELPEEYGSEGSGILDLINDDDDIDEDTYDAYLNIMKREKAVVKLKNKPAKTFTFKKEFIQDDGFDDELTPDEITLRYTSGLDSGEKTVKKNENWTVVAANTPFNGSITITEDEIDNFAAAGWVIEGNGTMVLVPMKHGDMNTVVIPPPNYDELGTDQVTRDRIATALEANDVTITVINTMKKIYSAEKTWEIDFADKDRPDELSVVLQRRDGWRTWTTVEIQTLDPSNDWSCMFEPVPESIMDEDPTTQRIEPVAYKYRVRELGPKKNQNDPDPDPTQDDFQEKVKERLVYDKWDLDKDLLANAITAATDPDTYWRWEPDMDWVKEITKKIVIPPPSVKFEIEQYNDGVKDVRKHTTKYMVEYKTENLKTKITNTAALDISIYKRWINFRDKDETEDGKDEKPEYVYLMLESKVQKEYAEHEGIQEANIYTPVMSGILGDYSVLDLPKVEDVTKNVQDGISSTMGGNFVTDAAAGLIVDQVKKKLKTGICIAKVDGKKHESPLLQWSTKFTVKKYGMGDMKLPMDFAGTELVTGLMEMCIDAIIKYFYPESNIHIPVMYHPIDSYWSITGYSLPIFRDWELTSNVINIKFHGDDDDHGEVVGGTKYWKGDKEEDRPESVKIHVYYKEGGTEKEVRGSPVEVKKGDSNGENGWVWSLEIPKDSEDAGKEYYIREDVPNGYTAEYCGKNNWDVINSKSGGTDPTEPTEAPTQAPTSVTPTTPNPTEPSPTTPAPTQAPTTTPTQAPTTAPTQPPTTAPTQAPTTAPTQPSTTAPTTTPTEPVAEQGKLKITATRPDSANAKEQSYVYLVEGPDGISLNVAIVLKAGETSGSAVIAKIPTGTYTVTEERRWSWRYSDGSKKSTAVTAGETANVTFDHTLDLFEWLNGYSHRRFR